MPHYDEGGVRQEFIEFLALRKDISLRRFSVMTGDFTGRTVSPGMLSCFQNAKSPGGNGKVSQEILEAISRTMTMYKKQTDRPVKTMNMRQIIAACERSRADQSMMVFIGESGYGKTVAFREYIRKHPEVIAITAHASLRKRPLLQELCKAVGYRYLVRMSPHQILLDLIEYNPEQIIVDEADKLTTDGFECLRYLRDNGSTSIIFIGLPCLVLKLRTSSNKRENLAQLYSRINYFKVLDPPSDEEIREIVRSMGIKKADLIGAIVKHSKDRYTQKKNLHRVEEIVKELKRTAVTNKKSLDEVPVEWVEDIVQDMIGGEQI